MPRIGGTRFSGRSNVWHGRGEEDPDSKPTIHRRAEIEVPTQELDQRVDSVDMELNCFNQCSTHWEKKYSCSHLNISVQNLNSSLSHDRLHTATKLLAFWFYHVLSIFFFFSFILSFLKIHPYKHVDVEITQLQLK